MKCGTTMAVVSVVFTSCKWQVSSTYIERTKDGWGNITSESIEAEETPFQDSAAVKMWVRTRPDCTSIFVQVERNSRIIFHVIPEKTPLRTVQASGGQWFQEKDFDESNFCNTIVSNRFGFSLDHKCAKSKCPGTYCGVIFLVPAGSFHKNVVHYMCRACAKPPQAHPIVFKDYADKHPDQDIFIGIAGFATDSSGAVKIKSATFNRGKESEKLTRLESELQANWGSGDFMVGKHAELKLNDSDDSDDSEDSDDGAVPWGKFPGSGLFHHLYSSAMMT